MAKKQTSSSSSQPAAKKKSAPAAAAPAAKKKPAPPKSAGPAGAPLIDTSLAANAAAAFVGNKLSRGTASGRQESASFKNLKQKLAKPHSQGLSNVLDTSNQNKKPNLPFGSGGNNQNVSHNQTYGADVNRAGVPRRTPG